MSKLSKALFALGFITMQYGLYRWDFEVSSACFFSAMFTILAAIGVQQFFEDSK